MLARKGAKNAKEYIGFSVMICTQRREEREECIGLGVMNADTQRREERKGMHWLLLSNYLMARKAIFCLYFAAFAPLRAPAFVALILNMEY